MTVIRIAEGRDAPAVARIYVASWNAGFGSLMPHRQVTSDLIERWRQDLADPTMNWQVAELNQEPVGFVGTGASRDPIREGLGELDTIAIDPPYWRHGIGRELMEVAIDDLVRAGFTAAILWTLANYPQGQGFYEATGWRLTGPTRDSGRQICYRREFGAAVAGPLPPVGTDQDQQTPPVSPSRE